MIVEDSLYKVVHSEFYKVWWWMGMHD